MPPTLRVAGFECVSVAMHPASSLTTKLIKWRITGMLDFFSSRYDQRGIFLLVGTEEGNIFVIDARPSKSFQIFGFTGMMQDVCEFKI